MWLSIGERIWKSLTPGMEGTEKEGENAKITKTGETGLDALTGRMESVNVRGINSLRSSRAVVQSGLPERVRYL
jgi:hypothetical protein